MEEHIGRARRVIPQRSATWASRAADALVALHLTPNSISVISLLIACAAAACLVTSAGAGSGGRAALLLAAAILLPLRLVANMLDGMLAVERGLRSPTGDLFNEVPDRLADLAVVAAAGYATAGVWRVGGFDVGLALGWGGAALALLTAYVRTLGAANGVGNFFEGPMAKPPRMWVLAAACVLSLLESPLGWPRGVVLAVALVVVALGAAATVVIRLRLIAAAMRSRAAGASAP